MSKTYVPTDVSGVQHHDGQHRRWPLPERSGTDTRPGAPVEPDEDGSPVLLGAPELLDELSEVIFDASFVGDSGAARLDAETAWSPRVAAHFALDCAEHGLGGIPGTGEARLPSGETLGEVVALARAYLGGTDTDGGHLGRLSRIAARRRLLRSGDQLSDEALLETTHDEGNDQEALDDPIFETIAAVHEAVLAAVEAVRHVAVPVLAELESRRYEKAEEGPSRDVTQVETPWGLFAVGGGGPRYAPAWACARDAAERAREAVGDQLGRDEQASERAWQASHLEEVLAQF